MKTQLSFVLAIICAMLITACGGGGTSQPVPADLAGYTVNDLQGTSAAVAQKFNENGGLIESGYIIGGNKTGQWSTYDDDGRISSVVNYIDELIKTEDLCRRFLIRMVNIMVLPKSTSTMEKSNKK